MEAGAGAVSLPRCGSVNVMLAPSGARMQGGKVTMPEFIRVLSTVLGRTVIDQTVFRDYLISGWISWRTRRRPHCRLPRPAAPERIPTSIDFDRASGAARVTARGHWGPVEVMVIDHVERPKEN